MKEWFQPVSATLWYVTWTVVDYWLGRRIALRHRACTRTTRLVRSNSWSPRSVSARPVNVLDPGAGSGIFTRQIMTYAGRATAVDPSRPVREALTMGSSGIEVLEGRDTATTLEDHVVHAVLVAQEFLWFEIP